MNDPKPMDCYNNPCFFRVPSKRGGMRTNGTCRCIDHLVPELSSARQREVERIIRATIRAHRDELIEEMTRAQRLSQTSSDDAGSEDI